MAESTIVERAETSETPETPDTNTDASIAQFDCPAENFALYDLFERVPDARIELDQTVAMADDDTLLVVRTDGHEHTVENALRSSPHITSSERFGEQPDGWMYRVRWRDCPRQFIRGLTNVNVTLLSARGRDGRWTFRLLAPDREGIASAHDIMDDLGCRAECRRITTYDGDESKCSPLTDEQREALISAVEAGYYDIPREVTADELADELGISHQALSERFRRAYRQLIESALVASSDG